MPRSTPWRCEREWRPAPVRARGDGTVSALPADWTLRALGCHRPKNRIVLVHTGSDHPSRAENEYSEPRKLRSTVTLEASPTRRVETLGGVVIRFAGDSGDGM